MTIVVTSLLAGPVGRSIYSGTYTVVSDRQLSDRLLLALGDELGYGGGQYHSVVENRPVLTAPGWRAVVKWHRDESD